VFGRLLSETLGKWNFWLMVIGMNLTFGPMHIVGLEGQARRNYRVIPGMGVTGWNTLESLGSFILAVGILLFLINAVRTNLRPRTAPADPWDARTLEWMTASPPKEHNFDTIPSVQSIDEFFHRKYEEDEATGEFRRVATAEEVIGDLEAQAEEHIHMPSPSYWPLVSAISLPIVAMGLIFNHWISLVGALVLTFGIYGWAQEPATADESDFDPPGGDPSKELASVG
jgi:cytochrome c oxidase subunit 1